MQFYEAILYNLFNYSGFWNFPKTSDIVAQYIYESHFRYHSAFEPNYILKKDISTISNNISEVNSVELKPKYNYYWNNVVIFDVLSCCVADGLGDYYPFGMMMPGRTFSSDSYRYGFNGMEKDDEIKGEGNSVNFKYRMHDPRIGRFFAVDPLASKYPWNSPFAFSSNIVIHAFELEGLEAVVGISMGGDVWYRKDLLKTINSGAVTALVSSPSTPSDPSAIQTLTEVLSNATSNDAMGEIAFMTIWGHGFRGNVVYGDNSPGQNRPTGEIFEQELETLKAAIENGDIVFGDNAVILITACNAGSTNSNTNKSFAQTLADITGVKVIAGVDVAGDGGVSPKKEVSGDDMIYQMRYSALGSFFQFEKNKSPVDIGNSVSTREKIKEGTSVTIPKMKAKPASLDVKEGSVL